MCGRYRLSRREEVLAEHFDADFVDCAWEPRYNIAPTQPVPVIRRDETAPISRASLMRWGLVPSWSTDLSIGASLINARSETAESKPSFRDLLRKQRCLIPGDAFYEWKRLQKVKQPFCFEVGDGTTFAFAGLWDRWRAPDNQTIETCTILTTTANALLADMHDRMPVILPAELHSAWLDPRTPGAQITTMLQPLNPNLMRRYPVSTQVNQVANDGPDCSVPVDLPQAPATLFDGL